MTARFICLALGLGLVAALLVGPPACYRRFEPACGFVCGPAGACPADYTCAADHQCHRNGTPSDLTCGIDAAVDAPPDAPPDAPLDAPLDAPRDAPIDATIDAPIDATIDAPIAG